MWNCTFSPSLGLVGHQTASPAFFLTFHTLTLAAVVVSLSGRAKHTVFAILHLERDPLAGSPTLNGAGSLRRCQHLPSGSAPARQSTDPALTTAAR